MKTGRRSGGRPPAAGLRATGSSPARLRARRASPARLASALLAQALPAPVLLGAALGAAPSAVAGLPPVPVPAENPVTEPKRVLGKALFWDEQLSADNTIACGSCHRAGAGGADPRLGRHPGKDAGTIDDVLGSPGVVRLDAHGRPADDPVFGRAPQVTPRAAPSNFGGLWAERLFWDGRAGPRFRDPVSGNVVIERHGALEAQTLEALANPAEMAHEHQTWGELTHKLARVEPLALAAKLPPDVGRALAAASGYPALFAAAFGDPAITPVRIAYAIASYERTLVADETPWDRFEAGDTRALDASELRGWHDFEQLRCVSCHVPPLFTDDEFFNTGLRRSEYDRGREGVTGRRADAGDMKVPSLRNAGLLPRYMHTGEFPTLAAAIGFYRSGTTLEDRDPLPDGGTYTFNMSPEMQRDLLAFIGQGLTDPRVRAERFPFDRPVLRSERHPKDTSPPARPDGLRAAERGRGVVLSWRPPGDDTGTVDYVVERDGKVLGLTTAPRFLDAAPPRGRKIRYRVIARDAAGNRSAPAQIDLSLGA